MTLMDPEAWQAYEEMYYDYAGLQHSCNGAGFTLLTTQPAVMATLAIGNEVFFASQVRGSNARNFVYGTVSDAKISQQQNL